MGFLYDEAGINAQHHRKGENTVAEPPQLFFIGNKQVRKQQHQRKFGQLRGLKLETADENPAMGVIDRRHEVAQDKHGGDHREQRPGQLAPHMVIQAGKNKHGPKAHDRPQQLPHNVVVAVAFAVIALRIAGAKHHHKPKYQQQNDHYQEGEVHTGILISGEQAAEESLL